MLSNGCSYRISEDMRLLSENDPSAVGNIHLVLFMTSDMSLSAWDQLGMFEREVALYRRLRPRLAALTIVTYGGPEDLAYSSRLPGINIVCNRWCMPLRLYRWFLARVLPRFWQGRVVVKTNQTFGADVARLAAVTAGGMFIARCGYMLSDFTAREHGDVSSRTLADKELERRTFTAADACIVTTHAMAESVAEYAVSRSRIAVVPNYVETDRLRPSYQFGNRHDRICFIGRLDDQKNVFALVEAMSAVPAELIMIGDGRHANAVKQLVDRNGARVSFLGRLDHCEIPAVLNSCAVFVLPSLYEGHPKALLEAMACGLPVVATDVPGIRDVVSHNDTGWLCSADAKSIAEALCVVLADVSLCERLGRAAREYILQTCSLDRVVELELAVLSALGNCAGKED